MTDADRGVIGGRYQVITSLGKGGMGQVYKAYDPILDRAVALKKMIATVVDSEEGRQRFYIEARAAARLNHPNIVTIHELEEYGGDIYIVMELLDGVSLAAFMRQRVHMPLSGYLTILAQIAEGLHYAHKRAIVHRDVKPPNLVLTTSGNLKILDFGIARLASNDITKKGKLLGTPHYMAPEQVKEEAVDARADLFSLGAVAYELVTGIKPFAGDSVPALLMQITSTPHRPVLEVAPETDPALAAIIDRLLAKDRNVRFATGMEVVAALDLIGEIDRVDQVAEAVAAVMGPSGEATVYAPIGSTPIPASDPPLFGATPPIPTVPAASAAVDDVTPPFGVAAPSTPPPVPAVSVTPPRVPAVSVPPVSVPSFSITPKIAPLPKTSPDDVTLSLSAPVRVPDPPPAAPPAPVASASSEAPTLVDVLGTPPLPDAPAPSVTLNTRVGAPSLPPPLPEPVAVEVAKSPVAPEPPPVPVATAPPASSKAAPPTPAAPSAASAPRGFVNPGVPQARHRSGAGAAVVVIGLLLLPAVVALGWYAFNGVRGAMSRGTTVADTTSPSTPANVDPASQKPAEQPPATTDQANATPADPNQPKPEDAPAETPGQEQPQTPAVDANAAPSAEKPAEAQPPVTPVEANPPANASQTAQSTPPPATQTPSNQAPPASQATATQNPPPDAPRTQPAQAPATQVADARRTTPANLSPGTTPPPSASDAPAPPREPVTDRRREVSPDTVVRDATRENTRREPAPPVREPAPPAESPRASEPSREPSRDPGPPSTPADTRSLDYGSLSAFRGGTRSTGSASDVYTDSPSAAAAVARITYALEAYGDAIAARDLDALRDVRSPVTSAESAMLKEGRATVRFSNLDVSLDGNDARVRCRRAVVANGKTVSSGPADVRLTRRPEGWVITDIR